MTHPLFLNSAYALACTPRTVSPFERFFTTPLMNACDMSQEPIVRQIGWTRIALTARAKDPQQNRESGQGRRPRVQKNNRQGACFSKYSLYLWTSSIHPPPMNKLPFKTADVQGQSRQSNKTIINEKQLHYSLEDNGVISEKI